MTQKKSRNEANFMNLGNLHRIDGLLAGDYRFSETKPIPPAVEDRRNHSNGPRKPFRETNPPVTEVRKTRRSRLSIKLGGLSCRGNVRGGDRIVREPCLGSLQATDGSEAGF